MGFDLWAFVELGEGYIPERMRKPARGLASLILLSSGLGLSKAIERLGHWTAEQYQALPPWIFPILQSLAFVLPGILIGYFLGRSRSKEAKTTDRELGILDGPLDEPLLLVGPKINYAKVDWAPVLCFYGDARDTIQIGDPLCPPCQAPLSFLFPNVNGHEITSEVSECPNEKCKTRYSFSPSIAQIKEKARRDAIGKSSRGELNFPGKPQIRPLLPKG